MDFWFEVLSVVLLWDRSQRKEGGEREKEKEDRVSEFPLVLTW